MSEKISYNYSFMGRLEDFQDEKYILLQSEDDKEALIDYFNMEDEFHEYLVIIRDGEYLEVYGSTGIHLSSLVYKYDFDDIL